MVEAHEIARRSLPAYSHVNSPRKFTQHQLLACLVLKEHQNQDYRGVVRLLIDCADLRRAIDLDRVPHFTTLQKAAGRLLRQPQFRRLLDRSVRRILGRRRNVPHAAADSTGFDARHASRYYVHRRDNTKADPDRPRKRVSYKRFGKLMIVVCCLSHAILAAVASAGPTPDIDQLDDVMGQMVPSVKLRRMALDAGFDSAHNHRLLRERHGIRSVIPPLHGRPSKDPDAVPTDRYRRLMKRQFRNGTPPAYRYRVQNETVNSMLKRNLGVALAGRSHHARRRDMLLRVLTHNCMLALLGVFYRAGHM